MEFIPPERSKRLHNFRLPYLRWGQYIPQGCQATVFRWAAQGSPAGAGGENLMVLECQATARRLMATSKLDR